MEIIYTFSNFKHKRKVVEIVHELNKHHIKTVTQTRIKGQYIKAIGSFVHLYSGVQIL